MLPYSNFLTSLILSYLKESSNELTIFYLLKLKTYFVLDNSPFSRCIYLSLMKVIELRADEKNALKDLQG